MGSTVAPKMFSQPGVFGTSDTSSVINKTNPMAGLAGAPVTPPPPLAPSGAPPLAAETPSTTQINPWQQDGQTNFQWLNGMSNNRGRSPAFYGY